MSGGACVRSPPSCCYRCCYRACFRALPCDAEPRLGVVIFLRQTLDQLIDARHIVHQPDALACAGCELTVVIGGDGTILRALEAVREAFAAHEGRIAAVITEASPANMGVVPPDPGFNAGLREITRAHGALMIFDEVLTGFRVDPAGYWGLTSPQEGGWEPDIFTFGKVIGGGLPTAALGGRREIMEYLAPMGPVYQAGTLSGNPVAMASGLKSLELADESLYERLQTNADRLTGMISSALSAEGVAHHIQRASSMFSIRFAEGEGRNFADMQAAETFRFTPLFHALLDNGIYVAPSPFETWFVSDALNDADFELIEAALKPAAQAAAAARPAN